VLLHTDVLEQRAPGVTNLPDSVTGTTQDERSCCFMTDVASKKPQNARQQLVAMMPKGGIGAEIGVWKGEFSQQLLQGTRPQTLYLIDPWVVRNDPTHRRAWYGAARISELEETYQRVLEQFVNEREKGTVVVKRGPSQDILPEFPDFIYIDGDHEYSAVRKDCFLAFDKVRVGGFVCGDDYALQGWWGDGVVRAFHELIAERPVIIRYARGNQIVLERLR
jgi:hypothetical protein